jgi:hypothetical protein
MAGIFINNDVTNYGGVPSAGAGLLANRPAAGVVGRLFIGTDTNIMYRDTGAAWVTIGSSGPTGSGADGQATFWTGASTISGDNAFFWDNTNKRLGLGTVTPGVRLDLHGTGVIQQLNGTTTNNAYLDFQNAGTTRWRVGNSYNTAANDWQVIDVANSLNLLTIKQNGSLLWRSPINTFYSGGGGDAGDWEINKVRGTGGSTYNWIGYINTWNASGVRSTGLWFQNTRGASFNTYAATIATDTLLFLNARGSTASQFRDGGSLQFEQYGSVGTDIPTLFKIGLGTATTIPSPQFLLTSAGYGTFTQRLNVNNATDNALFELNNNGNLYTGGLSPTILTVAVNTTMARTATGYYCTATLTLTLPSAASLNNIYWVIAGSGVTVTVNRAGSDDILNLAGASVTSITISPNQRAMFYVGGGTRTFLISQA